MFASSGGGEAHEQEGFRERISRSPTDAAAEIANALLENQVFKDALGAALGAGERAAQAQRAAMGAIGLSSSDDLERLERRLRSLSDRVEAVEDQLDTVTRDVARQRPPVPDPDKG
jgi:hypothetical protein